MLSAEVRTNGNQIVIRCQTDEKAPEDRGFGGWDVPVFEKG